MNEKMLTIITPTYNRAHTLPKCYSSLCEQTNKNFLWLIIDDGSTDDTFDLVEKWKAENIINIAYKKKTNGGKASALNLGIDSLNSSYAVCLDSDDWFYDDAVENALRELKEIESDHSCCGLLALRNAPDGVVMGGIDIPNGVETATATDIFLKFNLNKTELICFYKSEILKKYRFPIFEGEKFVSPSWLQFTITQEFYYKTSRSRFCICEYISDGLTKNKRKIIVKNPHGYTCVKKLQFDSSPTLRLMIKNGIMYDCGCLLGKDKNWLKNVKHKLLAFLLMPIAYYVKNKRFKNVL